MAQEAKPGLTFTNPKPYATKGERFILRVEAVTDGVKGMDDSTMDLMQFLATHPYIKSVKLLEQGPEKKNVKREK